MKKYLVLIAILLLMVGCNNNVERQVKKSSVNENKPTFKSEKYIDGKYNYTIERNGEYSLTGVAIVTGYYSPVQRDGNNTYGFIFNDFVVTDASELFMLHFKHLIDIGNTINYMDKGKMVIGLNFKDKPEIEKEIKGSSLAEQVKIVLEIPEPSETEANTYFNIMKVLEQK
jgi:hypothetical protein